MKSIRVIIIVVMLMLLFPTCIYAQQATIERNIPLYSMYEENYAVGTKDYTGGNNVTIPCITVRATFQFEWSSIYCQNVFTKVLCVNSFIDGFGFGEEWIQNKDWSYISNDGKELHCGVEGTLIQYILIKNFKLTESHHSFMTMFTKP